MTTPILSRLALAAALGCAALFAPNVTIAQSADSTAAPDQTFYDFQVDRLPRALQDRAVQARR